MGALGGGANFKLELWAQFSMKSYRSNGYRFRAIGTICCTIYKAIERLVTMLFMEQSQNFKP